MMDSAEVQFAKMASAMRYLTIPSKREAKSWQMTKNRTLKSSSLKSPMPIATVKIPMAPEESPRRNSSAFSRRSRST